MWNRNSVICMERSQKLLLERYGGDDSKKDIHERDTAFLKRCHEAALYTAGKYGWRIINCSENGQPRSVSDINSELTELITNS